MASTSLTSSSWLIRLRGTTINDEDTLRFVYGAGLPTPWLHDECFAGIVLGYPKPPAQVINEIIWVVCCRIVGLGLLPDAPIVFWLWWPWFLQRTWEHANPVVEDRAIMNNPIYIP